MSEAKLSNGPKNAVANRELTPEFKDKWDLDLTTIENLQKSAEGKGCKLILRGGMATEAFAGGVLTRAHNDIDAQFLNLGAIPTDEIFELVEKTVKTEGTNWQIYQNSSNKIEFREKEDERPFFNRRRLELKIIKEAHINPEKKKLIFGNGREIEVEVPEFYGFVAEKVKKLFIVNDKPEEAERETNLSDYADLKRLLNIPGYDPTKTQAELTKKIKNYGNREEARHEYDYVIDLLSQL